MAGVVPLCKPIAIDLQLFAENRRRLAEKLGKPSGEFALYAGAPEVNRNSSDTTYTFRQDTYFFHLFGLEVPDCMGAVDLGTGKGIVFIPRLPEEYAVWMGKLPTPEVIKAKINVEEVYYRDEIEKVLTEKHAKKLHLLAGTNSDSGLKVATAHFDGLDKFPTEDATLFLAHTELRVMKTKYELDFLERLNKVASQGHVVVMQTCKPGRYENQLEAAFFGYMMSAAGCKALAYGAIAATGTGPAILHYIENDRQMEDGDIALMDLGGELRCYASDITTTFPVNGKYTEPQRLVYNAVLAAHDAVLAQIKPGVSWMDMHMLAMRTIGAHLRDDLDLIRGTDEEIEKAELMAVFMPHGLGHLIGLEVHEVGGYLPDTPPRGTSPLTRRLRTARKLEAGIFITLEPGCYFNAVLLENAFKHETQKKMLNEEKLRSDAFWRFGGVRIESNIAVTSDGCRNFTDVPRKTEDVEAVMAGASWPRS
jgi:Xaa-Pro dipeptidase